MKRCPPARSARSPTLTSSELAFFALGPRPDVEWQRAARTVLEEGGRSVALPLAAARTFMASHRLDTFSRRASVRGSFASASASAPSSPSSSMASPSPSSSSPPPSASSSDATAPRLVSQGSKEVQAFSRRCHGQGRRTRNCIVGGICCVCMPSVSRGTVGGDPAARGGRKGTAVVCG